ncbi:MAG: serine phosphatase RsbU (regulator of sigma subunit) [Parvicella sp.]
MKFELKGDERLNRDGMEMGLAIINLDDLKLEFSGAGIPLYIVKKGTKELLTYKSPKFMIGGIDGDEKEVSEKLSKVEITLEAGDKIYMATDGFQDQFGGKEDKKFLSKRFKDLLAENSDLPMQDQLARLTDSFNDWKGNAHQTDDVLVFGFEI